MNIFSTENLTKHLKDNKLNLTDTYTIINYVISEIKVYYENDLSSQDYLLERLDICHLCLNNIKEIFNLCKPVINYPMFNKFNMYVNTNEVQEIMDYLDSLHLLLDIYKIDSTLNNLKSFLNEV